MAQRVELGSISDLKPGAMKMFSVGGHEYMVARVGDQYYATDNHCPHMGGNLSQGKLNGTVVTCPRHGSQFDLKDGHVIRWTVWNPVLVAFDQIRSPKRPLKMYPVVVEGDKIFLSGAKAPAASRT
jgi:3-phenylpropionate/trans-cinnamate dioxygenase ferredoxin subunit